MEMPLGVQLKYPCKEALRLAIEPGMVALMLVMSTSVQADLLVMKESNNK